jgi:hypothetical protein
MIEDVFRAAPPPPGEPIENAVQCYAVERIV